MINVIRAPVYNLTAIIKRALPLLPIALLVACGSTIPGESVELNEEIGRGILESRRSYTNIVNLYFAEKSKRLDEFFDQVYTPAYIGNIREALAAHGEADTFDADMVLDIVKDINSERDGRQAELEKARIRLLDIAHEHYNLLLHANATLTVFLKSAVDVTEAQSMALDVVRKASGDIINFDDIEKKFNDYLIQLGDLSGEGISFFEMIESLIHKEVEDDN